MGRVSTDDIDSDKPIFKTTICFRGIAKEFILELEHNKSNVINALISDAIDNGSIVDILRKLLPGKKVDMLVEKYDISQSLQQEPIKESTHLKQENKLEQADQMKSQRLVLRGKNNGQGDKKDGFDF